VELVLELEQVLAVESEDVVHIVYHFDTLHHEHNIEFHIPLVADSILQEDTLAPKDNILLDRVLYYYSNFVQMDNNGHSSDRNGVLGDKEPALELE